MLLLTSPVVIREKIKAWLSRDDPASYLPPGVFLVPSFQGHMRYRGFYSVHVSSVKGLYMPVDVKDLVGRCFAISMEEKKYIL